MKEAIVLPGPHVKIIDSPIPSFAADQVLVHVVVSGVNPKDWRVPEVAARHERPIFEQRGVKEGINQGDDIAGVVEAVGADVVEFKVGDRVAAFHEMLTPGGSYAEYAVAWSHTTFHLPNNISFEEGATIPLAALTAAIALYHHLSLPSFPWTHRVTEPMPLVVYGASTAVGSFAIKLARRSNIHPIIAIAGAGATYVQSLLDVHRGDRVIDYRVGAKETIRGVERALTHTYTHPHSASSTHSEGTSSTGTGTSTEWEKLEVHHALDTISLPQSTEVLKNVVSPGGKINFLLPDPPDVGPGIATSQTWACEAHQMGGVHDCRELCFVFCRWFTRALAVGVFRGHPVQVREGGLEGVQGALMDLKEGRASAVRYVVRIGDTPGLTTGTPAGGDGG